MTQAILFIPHDAQRWLETCLEYCARHGYEVIAIASTWADADLMAHERDAVVVAGQRDHLPSDRLPRLEVVLEEASLPDPPPPAPTQRRPRRRI
jgi:hypothetical protein